MLKDGLGQIKTSSLPKLKLGETYSIGHHSIVQPHLAIPGLARAPERHETGNGVLPNCDKTSAKEDS